jgi:hypothetical protein
VNEPLEGASDNCDDMWHACCGGGEDGLLWMRAEDMGEAAADAGMVAVANCALRLANSCGIDACLIGMFGMGEG